MQILQHPLNKQYISERNIQFKSLKLMFLQRMITLREIPLEFSLMYLKTSKFVQNATFMKNFNIIFDD